MALNEMKDKAKNAINIENVTRMVIKAYNPNPLASSELRYEGDVCLEELFLKEAGYTCIVEANYQHNYRRYYLIEKGIALAKELIAKCSST